MLNQIRPELKQRLHGLIISSTSIGKDCIIDDMPQN